MSAYDCNIEFTARATVSIAGPVAVTEIDADEVREDYMDAPEDWRPANGVTLEAGHYIVTGTYCFDTAALMCNQHYTDSEYKDVKWELIK